MYSISYIPLWKLLIDRQPKKSDLHMMAGLSCVIIAELSKNDLLILAAIGRISEKFEPPVHDVVLETNHPY